MICNSHSPIGYGSRGTNNSQNNNAAELFEPYLNLICSDHHLLDPSDAIFEKNPREQFSFFLMGLFGTVTVFSGVFFNGLTLVHLSVQRRRIRHKAMFLYALLIWDTILLINAWFAICLPVLSGKGHLTTAGPLGLGYNYVQTFLHVSLTGVAWSTVTLTVDRYISICRHQFSDTTNISTKSVVILALTTLSYVLFNIPRFFEIDLVPCCDVHQRAPSYEAIRAAFALPTQPYYFWYRLVAKAIVVNMIPFALLVVLTYKIIERLRQWHQTEPRQFAENPTAAQPLCGGHSEPLTSTTTVLLSKGANGHRNSYRTINTPTSENTVTVRTQKRLCRVLAFILVKFLICHSPSIVNDIIECVIFNDSLKGGESWTFSYMIDLGNFAVMFHSATSGAFFLMLNRGSLIRKTPPPKNQTDHECIEDSHSV